MVEFIVTGKIDKTDVIKKKGTKMCFVCFYLQRHKRLYVYNLS